MDPARANAVRAQLMQDLLNLASQHPTVAADMDPKLLQREKDRVVADLKALAGMKPTPEVKAETEEAQRKLGQINTLIDNIKPKNVTIGVHTSYTQSGKPVDLTTIDRQMMYGGILNGAGVQKFANGGVVGPTVKRFATGGVERHVAQIARPSSVYRVWAEPETGGEAYIPLAASKRQRSTQILEQVAAQFGMTLSKTQTFSNGGVVSGGNSKATGLQVHIGTFNQNATDTVEDIGRGIMRQARNAGVSGILEGI
jgi:hypothetical protein